MIEDEIRQEIQEERAEMMEEPCLFPKKEWDSLIHWSPVSNIYDNLPEAKRFHEDYIKTWKITENNR